MKAFFSWSGMLSKEIAEVFYTWLPSVLQNVRPYLSAEDIDKGEKWMNNISNNLGDTSVGLVFVTKENVASPWINYETGALSNSLKAANVCPILINLKKGEVDSRNPLFHYQATAVNEKEDILKLLKTINNQQGELTISDEALKKVFEWAWPTLQQEVEVILKKAEKNSDIESKMKEKDDISPMDEILALLRSMKKEQQMSSENEYRSKKMMAQHQMLLGENEKLQSRIKDLEQQIVALKEDIMRKEYMLMINEQSKIAKNAKKEL